MSDDGLMGRAQLERAFAALGDRLVRRGVVADLFIVGGAAMALAYDADRVTRDVDATFVPHGVGSPATGNACRIPIDHGESAFGRPVHRVGPLSPSRQSLRSPHG
jgi:hypothetical protein